MKHFFGTITRPPLMIVIILLAAVVLLALRACNPVRTR